MSDFFSKDSRSSGWVKVLFLLALTTSSVGTFLGGSVAMCGQPVWVAGACTLALALVSFLVIPRCSEEMEKWGRFKSGALVWTLFMIGVLSSGTMALASLFAWESEQGWGDLSRQYEEVLGQGMALLEQYEGIREDYFVLLKEKMDRGLAQSEMASAPSYMSSCPISLPSSGLSRSVINSRLATLKRKVSEAEGQTIVGAKQQVSLLSASVSQVGMIQRCKVAESIVNFQEAIVHLDAVMKEHISNGNCEEAPISATHGPWLQSMEEYQGKPVPVLTPSEVLKGLDVLAISGSAILFLLTLSPILFVRTVPSGSNSRGSGGTEI